LSSSQYFSTPIGRLASEFCDALSTIGQVRAAEAEVGRDIPGEEGAEDRLQLRVPVLGPPFRDRQEAEAVVHRVGAEVPLYPVRLIRREAEAVLRQP